MNVESNHPGSSFSDISLDAAFISEYMIHAPAEELKYYLVACSMAKSNQNEIDILELARFFQKGIFQIYEAFEYWREKNLVEIVEIDGTNKKAIENFNDMKHYEKVKLLFEEKDDFDADIEYEFDHNLDAVRNSNAISNPLSVTQMLKEASNEENDYEFSNFIARLEHLRKGKILSYEAKRRLLFYRINLGLSVDLIEFACNMSYENPHVKEYNHLNYARGILNNFYEANIFTLQDYYNRKRSGGYKIPTPDEIGNNTHYKKKSHNSYANKESAKAREKKSPQYTPENTPSENMPHSDNMVNKAMLKAQEQRQRMREKAKKKSSYKEDFT